MGNKNYKKVWYEANKERIILKERKRYEKNKDEINRKRREKYKKNREELLEKRREYEKKNKTRIKKTIKKYQKNNREKILNKKKEYRENNKESIKKKKKIWDNNNRKLINEYVKNKRANDPLFNLSNNIRGLIRYSIKNNGYIKKSKTEEILGCTTKEFKKHIESQWEPWMNWGNYGLYNGEENYGWDLDHVIPQSSAINEDGVIKLNHYTNFQPLCSHINRDIKKDQIT